MPRSAEVAEPIPRAGGAIIKVLAAHIPAYTAHVVLGARGYVFPVPLVIGPACIGLVESVAEDVFHLARGDVVLNSSLLTSGDVDNQEEILIGWTGVGWRGTPTRRTARMQAIWRNGVFAERALAPKESLIRLPGAQRYPHPAKLAVLPWLAIAAEALHQAEPRPGQVVVVIGATGQLGGAVVLMALAGGAARVVAVGRNRASLDRLAALDPRVVPVTLGGNRADDAATITRASEGGAHTVIDTLGDVPSADPTLAGYDALRPGGHLVLVGGVKQDLVIAYGQLMRRRLTVSGSFMFTPATALAVWRLIAAGTVDLDAVEVLPVNLAEPGAALELAATTTGLRYVVLVP